MYSYHTDLVLKIDAALLILFIAVAVLTIVSVIFRDYIWRRRSHKLLNIKRNVYELILSGGKVDAKALLPEPEITPQQFLDIATNRNRDAVFFNEAEQKSLQQSFLSKKRLAEIERIAKNSWSKWRRIEAILSLGYAHAESSLSVLKKTLKARDKDVSYFSVIALGQIRTLASAKILLLFFRKHVAFGYKIFSVLEAFPPEIVEEVADLTHDLNPQVRAWAVRLISKLRPERYIKRVKEMTQDKNQDVRAAACTCLGELGKPDTQDALLKCLNDEFWLVRTSAVMALSKVMGKDCIPLIIGRINDPSLSVIDSVKNVMAEHMEATLPYIEKFLYGEDEISKRVALEVMGSSGYIEKVLKDILGGNEQEKRRAEYLLKGLVLSRAHSGLQGAILVFPKDKRKELLELVRNIDSAMADHIEKDIAREAGG